MKIVHVEDSFDPTAGYQTNELLRIQRDNVQQIVIAGKDLSVFHKKLDLIEDLKFENTYNVKIIRLDVVIRISSRIILKHLWSTIKEQQPDILFLHGIADFKDLRLFFKSEKFTVVRDCHMSWVASINRYADYFRKLYSMTFSHIINSSNKYAKVYALGNEEYEYLRALGINKKKIDMLPHGYNKDFFFYDKKERYNLRKELKVGEDTVLISYIGKFDKYKKPDLIFDILELIPPDFFKKKKVKVLFLGPKDIDYMEKIFVPKMNNFFLKDKVQILPVKAFNELKGYYSASDICIWPKQTTLSSIHAQVCQTKVIMERHESNIERVINSSTLFEPDNLYQAKDILLRLIHNREYVKNDTFVLDHILAKREYNNQFSKLISVQIK